MKEQIGTLSVDRSYRDSQAPVYKWYPGQTKPQDGYLALDEDGEASVGYNPEIGNAVSALVYHGRELRWTISPYLNPAGIDQLMDAALPLLARVHAGHTVEWDGNNKVGRLTLDAGQAAGALERLCEETRTYYDEATSIPTDDDGRYVDE